MAKRRLLSPPRGDGEIVFLPEPAGFFGRISESQRIGTAHQPYFFHPGIAVKFIALEAAPRGKKEIVFSDTDRVRVGVKIPVGRGGEVTTVDFITTERLLYDYPAPPESSLREFLDGIEALLRPGKERCLSNFLAFKEIFMAKSGRGLLREILAESFMEYYGLKTPCQFLSEIIDGDEFHGFFSMISADHKRFRDIFNGALDEYGKEFRFRYRNFPFPKMGGDELPFWIVRDGLRERCFKKDLDAGRPRGFRIFPRAVTLTLFLRLYRFDYFIHGVGGWNYEWIQDRIVERFFGQTPPPYAAASGTFLVGGLPERELPYFLFDPREIGRRVKEDMIHHGAHGEKVFCRG
jgi:hypothetical protein